MGDLANNTPTVYDTALDGSVDDQGEIKQVWGQSALVNSLKMWIASYNGDVIGDPSRGGYVTRLLMKPMRTVKVDEILHAVRDGLEQDFEPKLRIRSLSLVPDLENRAWRFYLEVYSADLNEIAVVDEQIKGQL